jgi:predicted small lipoprotein YifL
MHRHRTILKVMVAAGLTALAACSVGKPMEFPEPESQLTSRPGAFTGDSGEWLIYRKQ